MLFEADCGVSTVLGEFRVASTAGPLVPAEFRATRRTAASHRPLAGGGASPRPKGASNSKLKTKNSKLFRGRVAGKFEIRNSKFEIKKTPGLERPGGVGGNSEFRIPNSEFVLAVALQVPQELPVG